MQSKSLTLLKNLAIEAKKDFQDLNNAEIMKTNLLKKITLNTLIMMNIEGKINLITMNMEEKRNLITMNIEGKRNLITMNIEGKRNLGLKSTVGEVEIEPFK